MSVKQDHKNIRFDFECPGCKTSLRCSCGAKVNNLEKAEIVINTIGVKFCTQCGRNIANDLSESLAMAQSKVIEKYCNR